MPARLDAAVAVEVLEPVEEGMEPAIAAGMATSGVGVFCISPRKGIFQALLGQSQRWGGCPAKALGLLGHLDRQALSC
jgi:hypothetical protein